MSDDVQQLLKRCMLVGVSTWSDALDQCGIAGVVVGLQQRSGSERFAGFAVTARETAGELGSFERREFGIGPIIAAVKAGEVLVIDLGGAPVSTMGGLAASAAKKRNAAAVIIDGGCRDLDEIQATGLWVASRHVTPVTGKTRLRLDGINHPVQVGGVQVRPGDLIAGDPTGLVVVPRDDLERVLAEAEKMLAVDHAMEREMEKGSSFTEAAAKANYIR
ncbi:MAG: RraA family protein [Variibacter sp.]